MEIKYIYVAGQDELHLIPDDEFESDYLLDLGRVGDSLKGELRKDPDFQYPYLILRKK